jgi:hypothetical protein
MPRPPPTAPAAPGRAPTSMPGGSNGPKAAGFGPGSPGSAGVRMSPSVMGTAKKESGAPAVGPWTSIENVAFPRRSMASTSSGPNGPAVPLRRVPRPSASAGMKIAGGSASRKTSASRSSVSNPRRSSPNAAAGIPTAGKPPATETSTSADEKPFPAAVPEFTGAPSLGSMNAESSENQIAPRRSAASVFTSRASRLSPGSGVTAGVGGFGSIKPRPRAPGGESPSPSRAMVLPTTGPGAVGTRGPR